MKSDRNRIKDDLVCDHKSGRTDGQAENNRASPTFVGGALIIYF